MLCFLNRFLREYGPIWFGLPNRGGDRLYVFSGKRFPSSQHFVHHASECPNVGTLIHCSSTQLLGTHIGRRASDRTVLAASVITRGVPLEVRGSEIRGKRFGQSEIENLHRTVGSDLNVWRL